MRRMNENKLIVFSGEIDVFLKNFDFVAAVLVEADFADTKNIWAIQEFRDDRKDVISQLQIL